MRGVRCVALLVAGSVALGWTGPSHAQQSSLGGLYFGAHFGAAFKGDLDSSGTIVSTFGGGAQASGSPTIDMKGAFGGAQVGYNMLFGQWLAGLETDFSLAAIDGEGGVTSLTQGGNTGTISNFNTEIDWFGTVRARLGYLITPNTVVYGTGGLAYAHIDTRFDFVGTGNLTSGSYSSSEVRTGYVLGLGAETAVDKTVRIKLEYQYIDLDAGETFTHTFQQTRVNSAIGTAGNDDLNLHTVRLGVNFALN